MLLFDIPSARAFQNPARFLEDATEAGGGSKRFFTGSPADGYTCKVCHAPGDPVHVDVAGLPLNGYALGATYTITLDWPDDLKAVGVNLEITDAAGNAAGELSVPAASQLTAADLCSAGPQSGAGVFPLEKRAVVLVGECGQHQTTVVWKAPSLPPGPAASGGPGTLWFSGSLVVSDADSSVAGDRVTDLRRALAPVGGSEPRVSPISATSSCQLAPGRSQACYAWLQALCLCVLLQRSSYRRRERQRAAAGALRNSE